MKYSKPAVSIIPELCLMAESQYVVAIDPGGDGCPDIIFNQATGTGTIDVVANYSIAVNFTSGTCQGTASTSGTAVFQDNKLIIDCSTHQETCNIPCDETGQPQSGQICTTSLVIGGEAQPLPPCINVDQAGILLLLNTGICD